MNTKKELTIAGRPFTFEFGTLAPQAESAVLARYGDTVVLATVAVSKRDTDLSYFPLSVEFAEKLYAGGRIKGSRWVKREGRPSDELILKARLIDRSIRPLFPKGFKKDVQVIVTVLSVDEENDPDMVGMLAVSCALSLSSIPWNGPIGAVRVGSIDGSFVINPGYAQTEASNLDLVVSARKDAVMMIEAGANQMPEKKVVEAIQLAHEEIKPVIAAIADLQKKHGVKKQEVKKPVLDTIVKLLEKSHKKEIIESFVARANKEPGSYERNALLIDELSKAYKDTYSEGEIYDAMDTIFKYYMRDQILTKKKRIDGRGLTDIRPLSGNVSLLPRTHGSALFQRGDTQALTITTLASPSLEQWFETATGEGTKRYMHHYNMPPYSVGETGRFGWPSRREIGHGALAERALVPVIPSEEKFPYTIHVVSEVLSSNGSTSMASTCGSTLSLMDAGVPITEPVAGISVGLVTKGDTFELLTDIMGVEDHFGDMDFKVAGTRKGVTAIQLDLKIKGISLNLLSQAVEQARDARFFILDKMHAVLASPREELSVYAPRITTLRINPEKIGELIGPGGKTIKKIIEETGVSIDIEDDGRVLIASSDEAKSKKAIEIVKGITSEPEIGKVYDAKVKRIMNFGVFCEFLPGKEGLVHVSELSNTFVKDINKVVKIGDEFKVKVIEVDELKRVNLSKKQAE